MSLLYTALTIGMTIAALSFLFSYVPDVREYPLPTEVTDAITTVFGYLNAWNYLIDLETLALVVTLVMVTELIIFLFNIITFILGFILKRT